MKTKLRILELSLGVILVGLWAADASAQAPGAGNCAAFAPGFAQGLARTAPMGALLATPAQVARNQLFLNCLKARGESAAAIAAVSSGTYTTFEIPGAGPFFLGSNMAINPAGEITATYLDASNNIHGYLRTPDGRVVTFDPPSFIQSEPEGLAPNGAITGYYADASNTHGYLRASNGDVTTFDVPGDACGTYPGSAFAGATGQAINPAGAITGYWQDSKCTPHGFVRAPSGAFTVFDPAGSRATFPEAISPNGAITGYYCDASACHGFVRSHNGAFTSFDTPGYNPSPVGIAATGLVGGIYTDPISGTFKAFVRAADGAITTVNPPGDCSCFFGTFLGGVNPEGATTGWFTDNNFAIHSFARAPHGNLTVFDVPGAVWTLAVGINSAGAIVGQYADANFVFHGFIRTRSDRERDD